MLSRCLSYTIRPGQKCLLPVRDWQGSIGGLQIDSISGVNCNLNDKRTIWGHIHDTNTIYCCPYWLSDGCIESFEGQIQKGTDIRGYL
jgi:hypothetical protein